MEEIAQRFKEELQELLDRYKDQLTTPQIMKVAQPVFTKTIGFKDNPERFKNYKEVNGLRVPAECLEGEFKWVDDTYTGPTPMRTLREVTKVLKKDINSKVMLSVVQAMSLMLLEVLMRFVHKDLMAVVLRIRTAGITV